MKKWKKVTLKVLLALSLTTSSIYIFAPWEYAFYYLKALPSTIQEQVDEATSQGIDGIIVYVDKSKESAKLYASGWHNRQEKIPAYGDALFKIASIAKLYEAAAVAKMVAAKQLSLDTSLAEYLPHLAERIENADQITLRMMVMHRSGIPNFTDQKGFDWSSNSLDVLELVLDKPADFAPGTEYAYSNTNYLLLTHIMTASLGYHYTQFIRHEMLAPLDLNHTFFSVHEVEEDALMSGYHIGLDDDFRYLDQGYVASARDVGVFLRALNDGSLLSKEESEIYSSIYEWNHTGWVLGYSSIARYHKDIDTVVIQFTNTTGDDRVMLTSIIYERILNILREQQN